MAVTLATISRDEVWELVRSGEPFVLVDANPPISFGASHLPGAVNIPPGTTDARAPRRIPDGGTRVVVYCGNPECDSSVIVGTRLRALGYSNVAHYADGKDGWIDAGLPLEGGRV